jgi:cyclophilin family peptidyl-prolyl cis-trans isomerase
VAKGGYQARRIREKKDAERQARRRARRNRLLSMWAIGVVVVGVVAAVLILTLTGGKGKTLAAATPSASASPSPSPTGTLPPGCTKAGPVTNKNVKYSKPPLTIDKNKTYTATFKTNCGTMTVDLLAKAAPNTVNSFVFLARKHFYDGVLFHRVIKDFGGPGTDMIQGGDAVNGNGTGGPGYQFADENPAPFNKPGMLAMANSGPNTNGSQFFFLSGPWSGGNAGGSNYSVFGQVTKGIEVIHRIATAPQDPSNNKPTLDVVLLSVTIEEK